MTAPASKPGADGEAGAKPVNAAHDASVRQEALRLAVEVHVKMLGALVSAIGDGPRHVKIENEAGDAAVLDTAEKFRAFLTVPGAKRDYVIQTRGDVRAVFSPGSSVALGLPSVVEKVEQAPGQRGSAASELRELLLFAEWLKAKSDGDAPNRGTA